MYAIQPKKMLNLHLNQIIRENQFYANKEEEKKTSTLYNSQSK